MSNDNPDTAALDLDAIRKRAVLYRANQMQHEKTHDRATGLTAAAFLCAEDVPTLLDALAAAREELAAMTERRNVAVENAQQYRKNWDSAVAANMTALETIGALKAQRDAVMTLCATTPDAELDTLPQRVREAYTVPAAAPQPTAQFALEVPADCPRACKTWCKAYEQGEFCPMDAAPPAAVPGDGEQAATTWHARTTHGHACCLEAINLAMPSMVAKCGGPLFCTLCGEDKARIHTALPTSGQA